MFNSHSNSEGGFLRSLRTRLIVIALLGLVGIFGYHFFKTRYKQSKISKEVAELQEQIDDFERKNKNLEQLASYLQTDDFKEREAKEKLNLVKEGEKVVIVKRSNIEKELEEQEEGKPEVEIDRPNYYWWWHYFFGIKPEVSSTNSQENQ